MARRKPNRPNHPAPRDDAAATQSPAPDHGAAAFWRALLLAIVTALLVARHLYPSESDPATGDDLPVVTWALIVLVFWLLEGVLRRTLRLRLGWIDLAVAALVAWYGLAAAAAVATASPRPAVNVFWQWLGFGVVFFLVRQLVAGRRELRAVLAAMIALATALSCYGLYQYTYEMPQSRQAYFADPDAALREAGMWFPPGSPERERFEKRLVGTEPMATFALANSLAGLLVPWVIVAVGAAASLVWGRAEPARHEADRDLPGSRSPTASAWRGRVGSGFVATTGIMAVCLLLTKSRAGYLAVLFGMAGLGWAVGPQWGQRRLGWKPLAAVVLILTLLIGIVAFSGGLDVQVISEAQKSLGYRVEYWHSSLRMIAQWPLFGCGPGNFQHAYTRFKLPAASEEVADPHNFLLEVAAEAGLPALAALLAVLGLFAARFFALGSAAPCNGTKDGRRDGDSPATPPDPQIRQSGGRDDADPNDPAAPPSTRRLAGPLAEDSAPSAPRQWPGLVAGGAIAGFVPGWFLGLISAAPPAGAVILIGLPVAALVIWLMWPWVLEGRLTPGVAAVAAAALLVNLLAAGGIGFSGVALSLWLLLALGTLLLGYDREFKPSSRTPGFLILLGVAVAALGLRATAVGPVGAAWRQLAAARALPRQADAHLRAAAEADPLAAEPWRQLMAWHFARWQQQGQEADLQGWRQASEALLNRQPNSSAAWLQVANQAMALYKRSDEPALLDRALKSYDEAVRLYPNSPLHRGRLALTLESAGQIAPARRQADRALELDAATPHQDKKLPGELRARLLRIAETQ